MTTYLGKSCSFGLPRVPFVNCGQFMYLVISLFGFEGRMWDLIVSVPDHRLSFYFETLKMPSNSLPDADLNLPEMKTKSPSCPSGGVHMYRRLSLSQSPGDQIKYFELSVVWDSQFVTSFTLYMYRIASTIVTTICMNMDLEKMYSSLNTLWLSCSFLTLILRRLWEAPIFTLT